METPTSQPDLNQELERLNKKFLDLQSLHKASRRQTLLLGFLMVLILACLIWEMIEPFRDLHQNSYQFVKSVEEQGTMLFPLVKKEIKEWFDQVLPSYQSAFKKEFTNRASVIEHSLFQEINLFFLEIQSFLTTQGEVRINHFMEKWRKKLLKDFPDLEKNEKKLTLIQEALQESFHSVIGTYFHKHFENIGSIRDQLEALSIPQSIKAMSYENLQEHILETLTKLLNEKFRPLIDSLNKIRTFVKDLIDQTIDIYDSLEREALKLPGSTKGRAK